MTYQTVPLQYYTQAVAHSSTSLFYKGINVTHTRIINILV